MGNIGSQQTGTAIRNASLIREDNWTQSYPRTPYQHKLVVPDRNAHQRLRPTGNGEILHAGGTISGRNHQWNEVRRSNSISSSRQHGLQNSPQKCRASYKHNASKQFQSPYKKDQANQMKRFGSEPDLRNHTKIAQDCQDKYKSRKKYKAPPPPPLINSPTKYLDFNEQCGIEIGSPIRRARLFKTRAETKKKHSSPVNTPRSMNSTAKHSSIDNNNKEFIENTSNSSNNKLVQSNAPSKLRNSQEFQAELREATKRFDNLRKEQLKVVEANIEENEQKAKLKTLDHNLNKPDFLRKKLKDIKLKEMLIMDEMRTSASGKESTPEQSPPKVKTFYFGMEEEENTQRIPNSIDTDISSESEMDTSTNDISLQLRPILPKKHMEIPRFSPAAAWKLLSSIDTSQTLDNPTAEETTALIEDKIEKLARPPPPYRMYTGTRSNNDKSGDSGISGDETPDAVIVTPRQRGASWTPQQDLGDDSSLEETSNLELSNLYKYPLKPYVFSLSLPRENHLAAYISERANLQTYTSLQKLKRSMSGVLAGLSNKKETADEKDASENWFLSRSAPNSLNNGFNSLELRNNQHQHHQQQQQQQQQQKNDDADFFGLTTQTNTRRIMYLPQSNLQTMVKKKHISKSYDNISMESRSKPENLQDPPKPEQIREANKKPKKFTFQSTVRQIERKRLADKLSKEAERKEQQRLRELEAMQRVEEEFQKKRAREKASIRQQLRLYSMEDLAWYSLPPNLELNEEVRPEPDGAVSSSSSSPTFKKNVTEKEAKAPVTQILSEFRQPHREYKEFRSGARHLTEQTTIHPRVTCNMPKASGTSYSGNYRKEFAQGIKSGESSYSEESVSISKELKSIIHYSRK